MEKLFYIFRHGQSSYNLAGRTQGQTNNSVLTPLGKEQAVAVGEKLKASKRHFAYDYINNKKLIRPMNIPQTLLVI